MTEKKPPEQELVVQISLRDIYDTLVGVDKKVDPLVHKVEDHEGRIRSLERQVWGWVGAAGVVSGVASAIVTAFVK